MKRVNLNVVLILIVFVFSSSSINAQIIQDYGIKISLTGSNISVTDKKGISANFAYSDKMLVSPSIGLFVILFKNEYVNVETELMYLRKGARSSSDIIGYTVDDPTIPVTIHVNNEIASQYLQFGVNAQFGGKLIYGIVGPTVNYLTSTDLAYTDNQLTRLVIGYNVGAGVNLIDVVEKNIFVEIKYIGDFTNFYYSAAKWWNKSWMLSFGTHL